MADGNGLPAEQTVPSCIRKRRISRPNENYCILVFCSCSQSGQRSPYHNFILFLGRSQQNQSKRRSMHQCQSPAVVLTCHTKIRVQLPAKGCSSCLSWTICCTKSDSKNPGLLYFRNLNLGLDDNDDWESSRVAKCTVAKANPAMSMG